jgi:hypothetical protein
MTNMTVEQLINLLLECDHNGEVKIVSELEQGKAHLIRDVVIGKHDVTLSDIFNAERKVTTNGRDFLVIKSMYV